MTPTALLLPQNVEPGESLLAALGVRWMLTERVERIGAPTWEAFARTESKVSRMAQQLCRGSLEKTPAGGEIDYEPYLDAFATAPDVDQIMGTLNDVPMMLVEPFLRASVRAYNYLHDHFPIAVEKTIFGSTPLRPGTYALGMFEDLLQVIDDPFSLFRMIEDGSLTTRQAACVKEVYPTLYQEIAVSIVERGMQEKAERPTWDPEFGRGLSVLLGVPGIDPGLQKQLAATPAPQTKPPPRARPDQSKRAALMADQNDRLTLEQG